MFYKYNQTENSSFVLVQISTISLSLPVLSACYLSVSIDKKSKLPRMAATLSLAAFTICDISS